MTSFLGRLRWWQAALLLSLALNVFLAAYAGGQWAGSHEPGILRMNPQRTIERLASRLPAADAALLRDAYRSREAGIAAVRKDYAEAAGQTLQLLAQPRLDLPALREAVAAVREHRRRMDELVAGALLAAVENMPAETRAALAKPPKRLADR